MSEERKAEDFPLDAPNLGPKETRPVEGSDGYELMMKSYNIAKAEYDEKLAAWLKEEPVAGIDEVSLTPKES
tara:strand:+ start:203 stop:418 length:216 start_codon:yes stop_codon:yes gene_type:complete